MTLYTALWVGQRWRPSAADPEPFYQHRVFAGAGGVPLFGWMAIPPNPRGTIIGTYGITGTLENQWFLRLLGRKAFDRNYAVVLYDWRAHGKTAELSPVLTSDGIYEGEDFVHIAAQAKAQGCPPPFWFTGFSLGGQLALWGAKAAEGLGRGVDANLAAADVGGAAVICPNLDSNRSLTYLVDHPLGRHLERAIAKQLSTLAWRIHQLHPGAIDADAIQRATTIRGFDRELVISRLGFDSVDAYYSASSPMHWLPHLTTPALILYAADDPMFDPAIVADLQQVGDSNPAIDLRVTQYGGHVGYLSNRNTRQRANDPDPWWAWNRILDWCDRGSAAETLSFAPRTCP